MNLKYYLACIQLYFTQLKESFLAFIKGDSNEKT